MAPFPSNIPSFLGDVSSLLPLALLLLFKRVPSTPGGGQGGGDSAPRWVRVVPGNISRA